MGSLFVSLVQLSPDEDLSHTLSFSVIDVYQQWAGPCKSVEGNFKRIKLETGEQLLKFALVMIVVPKRMSSTIEVFFPSLEHSRLDVHPCVHLSVDHSPSILTFVRRHLTLARVCFIFHSSR